MAVSAQFLELITEQMEGFGHVDIKRMFGGAGVFREGLMFALVSEEALYFKVGDGDQGAFEDEGSGPFMYEKNGRSMAMGYWRLPERLYDDREEFSDWARRAFQAALSADCSKPKSKRKHTPV